MVITLVAVLIAVSGSDSAGILQPQSGALRPSAHEQHGDSFFFCVWFIHILPGLSGLVLIWMAVGPLAGPMQGSGAGIVFNPYFRPLLSSLSGRF